MILTSYFYTRLSSSPSTLVQQTAEPKASSSQSTANSGTVEREPQQCLSARTGPQQQRTKQRVHRVFQV